MIKMFEVESELRKWGRSVGVVVPKEFVVKTDLKAGDSVKLLILKKTNALEETFGKFKLRRSTDEMLKEIDEEGWDE